MLMSSNKEVEIKFRISNLRDLNERMQRAHFRLHTPRTHEMNTLYDLPAIRCAAVATCFACANMALSGCSPTKQKVGTGVTKPEQRRKPRLPMENKWKAFCR